MAFGLCLWVLSCWFCCGLAYVIGGWGYCVCCVFERVVGLWFGFGFVSWFKFSKFGDFGFELCFWLFWCLYAWVAFCGFWWFCCFVGFLWLDAIGFGFVVWFVWCCVLRLVACFWGLDFVVLFWHIVVFKFDVFWLVCYSIDFVACATCTLNLGGWCVCVVIIWLLY